MTPCDSLPMMKGNTAKVYNGIAPKCITDIKKASNHRNNAPIVLKAKIAIEP